ncbi:MAG: PAS domain S-box protein [Opitutaceae bacterium]|nr:PAS domain S-box protein [Opitutaceae bacterium]
MTVAPHETSLSRPSRVSRSEGRPAKRATERKLSVTPAVKAKRRRLPAQPVETSVTSDLLAQTLRMLPEGVFVAEPRWQKRGLRILFANEQFCQMTGYSENELCAGTHTFLHVDKSEIARQQRWVRSVARGQSFAAEGYLKRRDGSVLFASWHFSPLCDAGGQVTHMVASYRDMTEKRRLQDALIQAQRIDAVGRLAGGVAHDFNNLLSVINGYSEILADRLAKDERARHDLAEIHEAGQKAAALTRQLLAFSRRQSMDPRVISLNELILGHAELLGRLLRPDKRLNLALASDLGNVRVDPAALQQVLLNLTLNARDALSAGGHLTISTVRRVVKPGMTNRRLPEMMPGRYIQMSVSDSGSGMDEHVQAHLFEPFFTTKPQGKGTGLGLALVYGVVQQSGGFISVHSAPGVGTTFDIYLPEVNEPASARPPGLTSLPVTGGRESILIVEDDDVLRKMIAGILTADGYTVQAVGTTDEGLIAARRTAVPVQLVIVDCSQPNGDGERLVRALHVMRPELRVLSTSDVEMGGLLSWLPPAAQAHLAKPFTLSTLLKVLRTLLDAAPHESAVDTAAIIG